ncbi:NAD(P)H-binding protein [Amycolatopsis sp. YIM 10]|uniref:NAD(P)H-binding protein n=1 Tax=Amycolatopsis sp. YIM 10 TaxID=2653857 RepID=UPI0012AAAF22|nr:NAD(P)H-binding protein [Amycolatopsis sp. YIM 10]QFU92473.1 NAD(P)H azoreductase [Amycolatopsis sp. YIM 10]
MTTTTLVLGGTGKTGRHVVSGLRAAGHRVRPASRSGEVRFDWADESTWDAAVTGAEAVYLVFPDDDVTGARPFIRFAVEHGVRRLVALSGRGIEEYGLPELLDVEHAVRESGVDWTILRPSWFNQNFDLGQFRDYVLAGDLRVPTGGGREPFIDATDIAAVAVAALTDPRHAGQTYELTGPRSLSFGEAAAEIARASGRKVTFTDVTDDEFLKEQEAAGVPESWAKLLAMVFGRIRRGEHEPVSPDVAAVLGRDPMDFADYATGAWGRSAAR